MFYFLGVLSAAYYVSIVFSSFILYARPPKKLGRYLHANKDCWALVTGASDGIGFGFAQELCDHKFNVILHGRNREKLEGKKKELEAQFPNSQVAIVVADAGHDGLKAANIVKEAVADKHLTVIINNLAVSTVGQQSFKVLESSSTGCLEGVLDTNVRFLTHLTSSLLPSLKRNTPSLIMTVGSLGSTVPSPYIQVYASTKAYQIALGRSLSLEMELEKCDVEVLGVMSGEVNSGSYKVPTGFFVPTSRKFASAALDMVGSGHSVVTPFLPHFLSQVSILLMPEWALNKVMGNVMRGLRLNQDKTIKNS